LSCIRNNKAMSPRPRRSANVSSCSTAHFATRRFAFTWAELPPTGKTVRRSGMLKRHRREQTHHANRPGSRWFSWLH
jgi:hypothetical protein